MSTNVLHKIVRWCALILVWAPLAYLPVSLYPLSYVQSVVVQVIVGVMTIAASWVWYRDPSLRFRWSALRIALVVFILVQWVCAALGVDWWQSVWSDMARATGLWYQTHIIVAILIVGSPLFSATSRLQIMKSSLWAACVVVALAVVQSWNPDVLPNVSAHRVGSTLGNPVLFASYVFLQLGIATIVAQVDRRSVRGVVGVYSILAVIALLIAQARGTYLGIAVGVLFASATWTVLLRKELNKKKVAQVVGSIALAGLLLVVVVTQSTGAKQWVQGLTNMTTLSTRLINWGVAWEGFLDRPIVGWGPENYRRINDVFYNPELSKIAYVESYVDKPHNQFLELIATSGVVGAVAFGAVVVLLLRILVAQYRKKVWDARMVAVLAGIGVGHAVQMSFLFENPGTYVPIVVLVGWVLAQEQHEEMVQKNSTKVIARSGVWMVTAVVGSAILGLSIVPLVSASMTNYGLQLSYVGKWDEARVRLHYAYDWYTPYQLEQWRWSASALTDMVHVFAPDHRWDSLSPEVQGWVDRDARWIADNAVALLSSRPRTYLTLSMIGKVEYQMGTLRDDRMLLERALERFKEATALSPAREEGYILQSQTLLALARPSEATRVMKEAIERAGESSLVDWYYGFPLLADPARAEEGLRYVERAIDMQFVFETAAQVEGVTAALVEKQRYDRLVQLYEIVVQQLPNDALWWSRLALAYAQVGRKDEARTAALHAVEIDPSYRAGAEQFLTDL